MAPSSAADLARRVCRALEIAETTLTRLVEREPGVDLTALEAPPDKIVAETAMLLRAVHALPDRAGVADEKVVELARLVSRRAQCARIAVGMALHPALAHDYGAAHIVLAAIGLENGRCREALARAARGSTAAARERLPHRELEQAWLAALAGGPKPAPQLAARSALGRGADVLFGTRDDLYALTHALMYATDFGAQRPRLPRAAWMVAAECDSALAGALDDDDFDLAGELLLATPFLRRPWSPAAAFGFSVLVAVEDEVGLLPSLSLDRAGFERHEPADREAYVAAVAYHTAYVMGLLCAAVLRAERPPPALRRSAEASPVADALAERLAAGSRRPQWLKSLAALEPQARAPLAPFLLDVAVRRAARAVDLGQVRQLLIMGVEAHVAPTPLRLQAAELLRRLADDADFEPPAIGGAAAG